jgi:hypothetical protein
MNKFSERIVSALDAALAPLSRRKKADPMEDWHAGTNALLQSIAALTDNPPELSNKLAEIANLARPHDRIRPAVAALCEAVKTRTGKTVSPPTEWSTTNVSLAEALSALGGTAASNKPGAAQFRALAEGILAASKTTANKASAVSSPAVICPAPIASATSSVGRIAPAITAARPTIPPTPPASKAAPAAAPKSEAERYPHATRYAELLSSPHTRPLAAKYLNEFFTEIRCEQIAAADESRAETIAKRQQEQIAAVTERNALYFSEPENVRGKSTAEKLLHDASRENRGLAPETIPGMLSRGIDPRTGKALDTTGKTKAATYKDLLALDSTAAGRFYTENCDAILKGE